MREHFKKSIMMIALVAFLATINTFALFSVPVYAASPVDEIKSRSRDTMDRIEFTLEEEFPIKAYPTTVSCERTAYDVNENEQADEGTFVGVIILIAIVIGTLSFGLGL